MSEVKPHRNPDQVVWTVVWLLGLAQVVLSVPLYRRQAQRRGFPDEADPYFNYVYTLEWAMILGLAAAVQAIWSDRWWVALAVAPVALWRIGEIIVWYTKPLLADLRTPTFSDRLAAEGQTRRLSSAP